MFIFDFQVVSSLSFAFRQNFRLRLERNAHIHFRADDKEVDRDGADIAGSEDQQDLSPTDDADVTSPTASLFSSWSDDSDVSSSKSCDEDDSDLPS